MFTYFKKIIILVFITLYCLPPDALAKEEGKAHCPKTLVTDQEQCARCHVFPSWRIKETSPEDRYRLCYSAYIF